MVGLCACSATDDGAHSSTAGGRSAGSGGSVGAGGGAATGSVDATATTSGAGPSTGTGGSSGGEGGTNGSGGLAGSSSSGAGTSDGTGGNATGGAGGSAGGAAGTSGAGGNRGKDAGSDASSGKGGLVDGGLDPSIPTCPGDPTEGFTEYMDTFKVQHPYDLMESDRFSFQGGIYTTWVLSTDKPFEMGSATGPRTEMRWSQDWSTGERIWDGNVMYESPSSQACIMQVKGEAPIGGEAVYLQVNGGNLRNSVQKAFLTNSYDKWMNIKTAYNTATRVGRVWVNNCLLYTTTYSTANTWYFKNGTYGCNASICKTHFKNIRFWQR